MKNHFKLNKGQFNKNEPKILPKKKKLTINNTLIHLYKCNYGT